MRSAEIEIETVIQYILVFVVILLILLLIGGLATNAGDVASFAKDFLGRFF